MKKYSSDYFKTKQDILKTKITPLLNAIKNTDVPTEKIIKESMRHFQVRAILYDSSNSFYKHCDNFSNQYIRIPLWFEQLLLIDKDLKQAYIDLNQFYFGDDNQDIEKKRSIVREILFEIVAPFDEFKLTSIDTAVVERPSPVQWTATINFTQLPQHIHLHIMHFFQDDVTTIINYRTVSKQTYATQKLSQNNLENVFYAISKPITIARPPGLLDGLFAMCLRKDISDNELTKATTLKHVESVKLFKSFYDAVEYAHTLKHGGGIIDSELGVIPAVMMVSSIIPIKALVFEDEIILVKESCRSLFDYNERNCWVSYATVKPKAILPLAAISLFSKSNFGSYYILHKNMALNQVKVEPAETKHSDNFFGKISSFFLSFGLRKINNNKDDLVEQSAASTNKFSNS